MGVGGIVKEGVVGVVSGGEYARFLAKEASKLRGRHSYSGS